MLIRNHSSLAGWWVACNLAAWLDWRSSEQFAELRDSQKSMDGASAYAIDYYIVRGQKNP